MNTGSKAFAGVGLLAIAALTIGLFRARDENISIRAKLKSAGEQVANLENQTTRLSNQVAISQKTEKLATDQVRELMRLRNEVVQLRQNTNELGRGFEQGQRDLAVTTGRALSEIKKAPLPPGNPAIAYIPMEALPARPPDPPALFSVYEQARFGMLTAMKAGLDENPNFINEPVGVRGSTMLHTAAFNGHSEVVQELLKRGANVNQRNYVGESILYSAVLRGTPEVVRILLEAGADPSIPDIQGLTPLQFASDRGRQEIADLLQKAGAK